MESPLDRQMAGIKDKAELVKWVSNLAEQPDGIILINDPNGRVIVRHLGSISLKTALWTAELYKQWILVQ